LRRNHQVSSTFREVLQNLEVEENHKVILQFSETCTTGRVRRRAAQQFPDVRYCGADNKKKSSEFPALSPD
jgi:hypothetical protein